MSTPARHSHFYDCGSAGSARLALPAEDMYLIKVVPFAHQPVAEETEGGSAVRYCLGEHGSYYVMEASGLGILKTAGRRVNPRSMQGLVGINVPKAGDHPLTK